jgi:Arc/MetJ family transcription regulator
MAVTHEDTNVDPVKQAQIEVLDECVKKAMRRFEINPKSQYLILVDRRQMRDDLIAQFALGLTRQGVKNVILYVPPDVDAFKIFEEKK